MTDNPREWQPPFDDDDEFWRRFEDSLNRAQGNRGGESPSSNPPSEPSQTPPEPDDVFVPPEPPPISAPPDAIARAAWLAVIIGPALAMVGYVFAISSFLGGIGIGATIVGFVILIARRDRHIPPGEDHGDGAVV